MNMEVYIIGAGNNCKIIIEILKKLKYEIIGIFDDDIKKNGNLCGIPICGRIENILNYKSIKIVNSIGCCQTRKKINDKIGCHADWINCIHPEAIISDNVILGVGNIICRGAVINTHSKIGNHNLINTNCIIEHDCIIGDYNHIAPASILCGGINLGHKNLIGANSTIIPNINIGNNNIIGAAACLIKSIQNNTKNIGIPAKQIPLKKNMSSRWPLFSDKMIKNVVDILSSGKVNQWTGSRVFEFEKKFSEYFGIKHSVAVCNGTVALELCLQALDIKSCDEVIVTSRSFIASASCISVFGAKPVFVDVNMSTRNMDLSNIMAAVTTKTRAVILVHLGGIPCQVQEIVEWCHQNNIYVIEDCAQSHGAKYNNKYVGTFGDINAWSFCQDKIISTGGEGGMVTTNNMHFYKRAWSYKDHGKNYDKMFDNHNHEAGIFRWLHDSIGTNWRMTEIQASIGIDALEELSDWISHRNNAALIYDDTFKHLKLIQSFCPETKYPIIPAYYKYYCYIDSNYLLPGMQRDDIIREINSQGVPCYQGSCGEIYKELAYNLNIELPNSKILSQTSLVFLLDPSYTIDDIRYMADIAKNILLEFTR